MQNNNNNNKCPAAILRMVLVTSNLNLLDLHGLSWVIMMGCSRYILVQCCKFACQCSLWHTVHFCSWVEVVWVASWPGAGRVVWRMWQPRRLEKSHLFSWEQIQSETVFIRTELPNMKVFLQSCAPIFIKIYNHIAHIWLLGVSHFTFQIGYHDRVWGFVYLYTSITLLANSVQTGIVRL